MLLSIFSALFGKVGKIVLPTLKWLVENATTFWKVYDSFSATFALVRLYEPSLELIKVMHDNSFYNEREIRDGLKTLYARQMLKRALASYSIAIKDVYVNTLIEVVYLFQKNKKIDVC